MIARTYGVARSLAMYYGPVWRRRRMVAFYRQFVGPGQLAFDVGAHVGNRVRALRALGARVVAFEPQPDFVRVLGLLYGRDRGVALEPVGLGAAAGPATLHISQRAPTLSTLASDWRDEVRADRRFEPIRWDRRRTVLVTTLDAMIARHGEPAFVKIDVEGGELDVLRGLSRPLAALSFEYLPVARRRAIACVERLTALGGYRFRTSRVETMRWHEPTWLGPDAVIAYLAGLPIAERSGDVYAVRDDEVRR